MIFTDIRLQNFRSYTDDSFEIGEGVTIIVGPNAAGKTNLIEALMLAATGSSFRGNEALIAHGEPWARIDVHTTENNVRTVKLRYDPERILKEFIIEEKSYKRLPPRQRQPVVLFEPNNLLLLHGEPAMRRNFMDDLAEQISDSYIKTRASYKRTLTQRNALLKQGHKQNNQLFAWNIRLSELASQIVTERLKLAARLNEKLNDVYESIAKSNTGLAVEYTSKINLDTYGSSLLKKLESAEELDYARGFTGDGPHRDDLKFVFSNQTASTQASRGEVRTLLLALKIIELELLEEHNHTRPLLLLDDVFSELDGARRKALTKLLSHYQTVITTTDADVVVKNFTTNCTIIPLQKNDQAI
jgi:DNA replication and repair protein RecF